VPSEVLATRYAEALAGAIDDNETLEQIDGELRAIAEVVGDNERFKVFIEGPNVRDEDKHALVARTFGDKVHPLMMDFLKLLIDKHRVDHLVATASAFRELVETRRNQLRVQVTTAFDIPVDMADRLKRALDASVGMDCILDSRIDKRIVGGVIVKLGDRVIDGSVKTALNEMRDKLMHADL